MQTEVQDRPLKKLLQIPLTHEDVERMAKEAAEISQALTADRIEFKKIRTEWKDRIVGSENALSRVLKVIQVGHEEKEVDCIERRIFAENKVQYIVNDKVIEERAMDAEERQMEMHAVEGGGGEVIEADFKKAAAGDVDDDDGAGFPVGEGQVFDPDDDDEEEVP
jgi:hypothetical protein